MNTDTPTDDKTEGSPQDVRNGMATAALVVGILAVILVPVGMWLGLVAPVLAIIALIRARHMPRPHSGRMRALIGSGLGILGVFVSAYGFWIPGRLQAIRAVCASNLRSIGLGIKLFANDRNGVFPVAMYSEESEESEGHPRVRFVGNMGAHRTTPLRVLGPGDVGYGDYERADPNTPGLAEMQRSVHPSRSLFLLVMDGTVLASTFVCRSSGDVEDDLRVTPAKPGPQIADGEPRVFDFKGYPCVSYGYQLPFSPVGRPSPQLNPRMPIMADKGPFFKAGPPRADGTVPDAPTMTPRTAITLGGATTADALLRLPDSAWRQLNSRNHQQAGQNVLFVDGHVEWVTKPIVGVDHDNIYTVQSGESPVDILLGRTPADELRPRTNSDSVIVP